MIGISLKLDAKVTCKLSHNSLVNIIYVEVYYKIKYVKIDLSIAVPILPAYWNKRLVFLEVCKMFIRYTRISLCCFRCKMPIILWHECSESSLKKCIVLPTLRN
jgi:hypothetical protein